MFLNSGKNRWRGFWRWAPCLVWFLAGSAPVAAAETWALVDVNVIPMDGERVLTDQTVIIRDGVITKLGPSDRVELPERVHLIQAKGHFLLPGLVDMHVHLNQRDELFLYPAFGVTRVFNLDGAPKHLQWRGDIRAGKLLGPRVYTVGPTLRADPEGEPDPAEWARLRVQAIHQSGYDGIKLYSDTSAAAYYAAVDKAAELGLPVFGHFPHAVRARPAIAHGGLHVVAHAEEFFSGYFSPHSQYISSDEAFIPDAATEAEIAEAARLTREAGMALIPNHWFNTRILAQAEDLNKLLAEPEFAYLPALTALSWFDSRYAKHEHPERFKLRTRRMLPFLTKITNGFDRGGVLILLGSDASVPGALPGYSAVMEIQHMVAGGLSPYRALLAATANAGRFFADRLPHELPFGLVAEGYAADLLLVSGNPLVDPKLLFEIEGVMIAGRWLPRETIRSELARRAERYPEEQQLIKRLYTLLIARDIAAMRPLMQRMHKEFPDNFLMLDPLIGQAADYFLKRAGDLDTATALARFRVDFYAASAGAHTQLADFLKAAGKFEEARRSYLEALARNPEDQKARAGLDLLNASDLPMQPPPDSP